MPLPFSTRSTVVCPTAAFRRVIVSTLLAVCATLSVGFTGRATGEVRSSLLPRIAAQPAAGDDAVLASENFLSRAAAFQPNYAVTANTLRHWDRHLVTVHVVYAPDEKRTEEQTLQLVSKGLGLWNRKIGSMIELALTDDADAAVTISFVKPGTLVGGAIGRTDVTFRLSDQVLTHAAVRLNEHLSDNELVQVTAHEIGHALGVQGHSQDRHDLMYAYAHLPAEITDRDLNTMALSYRGVPAAAGTVTLAANNTLSFSDSLPADPDTADSDK